MVCRIETQPNAVPGRFSAHVQSQLLVGLITSGGVLPCGLRQPAKAVSDFFFMFCQRLRVFVFSAAAMEPPSKKMRKLLDDDSSDSGDDAGGVLVGKQSPDSSFKVNEDYARRFEHNKKREEVQKRMCNPFFGVKMGFFSYL